MTGFIRKKKTIIMLRDRTYVSVGFKLLTLKHKFVVFFTLETILHHMSSIIEVK